MGAIKLRNVQFPSFGVDAGMPMLEVGEYEGHLRATVERMAERKFDVLAVYGDREHSANLAFLTGYDPRFEEALLLLDRNGRRKLLVGNEGLGYVDPDGPKLEVELYQDFSLLGQPRDRSAAMGDILRDFGVVRGARVGCVGWKYFHHAPEAPSAFYIEIPAYLVDLLRELTGDRRLVSNATDLFMHAQTGLRAINSAAQIARFEFASCRTSMAVRDLLVHLKEGLTERQLADYLRDAGLPHSCHAMISTGDKVRRGLSSPSDKVVRRGDPFVVAFGLCGALTCRAGTVAANVNELPADTGPFFHRLAMNYFEVVAAWYEKVRRGARGGDVFAAVNKIRNPALFDFALNPGHLLHLDEWLHSPFAADSGIVLQSGMAIQADIIPVSQGPFWYVNAEDGLALADENLRNEIADRFPTCWRRIRQRQQFMRDVLGIHLDDSTLPLGNMPALLSPYLLNPDYAICVE